MIRQFTEKKIQMTFKQLKCLASLEKYKLKLP